MSKAAIRSPSYPVLPLQDAVSAVRKIEAQYRSSAVDREVAAAFLGYKSLSGSANKALSALSSYGLVERAGKGMMRITSRAKSILHPHDDSERLSALREAGMEPRLFKEIKDRFPDHEVPPEEGVRSHLNREGFNPNVVSAAVKAVMETAEYLRQEGATESNGHIVDEEPKTDTPSAKLGGAVVGDLIQWESGGELQFSNPSRVRWVSDDGDWLAVEGSDTGIPMSEITVESAPMAASAPMIPPAAVKQVQSVVDGFSEWFRAKVGADKLVTINFKGEGEIGPKEIEKMIRILEAQKLALED